MKRKDKKCIEANINFINTVLVLIFTEPLIFTILLTIPTIMDTFVILYFGFLTFVSCILIYLFCIKRIIRYIIVRKKGKIVRGVVKKYFDDSISINDKPVQIIKLEIITDDERKEIDYRSSETEKKYEINTEIELYNYDNMYIIKDKKKNIKEISIIVIVFLTFVLMLLYLAFYIYIPYFSGITLYQRKMNHIEEQNKEVRSRLVDLKYEIPSEFNLSSYEKNQYVFSSKNEKHNCYISLDSTESNNKVKDLEVNSCQYIDINNNYHNYEEKYLGNSKWCYEYKEGNNYIEEKYMKNAGKYYYSISLTSYKDEDEVCSLGFYKFINSLEYD